MKSATIILALMLATQGHADAHACRFRPPLNDADAARLLLQTPAALGVRPHHVDVQPCSPRDRRTFSAALISRTPSDGVLDNGLLGQFAVDRRTGRVTALADFTVVRSRALAGVRVALCRARARR